MKKLKHYYAISNKYADELVPGESDRLALNIFDNCIDRDDWVEEQVYRTAITYGEMQRLNRNNLLCDTKYIHTRTSFRVLEAKNWR